MKYAMIPTVDSLLRGRRAYSSSATDAGEDGLS